MNRDTTAGPGAAKPGPGAQHGGGNTPERRLTAAERSRQALDLRLRRVSYDEIARQLGYSHRSAARKAVAREIAKVPRESAKELLAQELETLDLLQAKYMSTALSGKASGLWALDRMLAIHDRRVKLMGLDKIGDDSGVDEFKAVLKAWAVTLAAQVDADEAEDAVTSESPVTDDESPESHA